MSEPAGNVPAAIWIVALPPLSAVTADVYVPLVSVTVPVGIASPALPLTATVTNKARVVVVLAEAGVAVTVGVVSGTVMTVTVALPDALLYRDELAESGR